MLAWRLCREPFSDLGGDGARRFGRRWNSPGAAMVYAASSAALAVLEVRVHLDLPLDLLPGDYVLLTLECGDASLEVVGSMPPVLRTFGDAWLRERRTALLQVPSAIVAESPNVLLNPAHPDAGAVSILRRRFDFDRRPWGAG